MKSYAVGLSLPYAIEFSVRGGQPSRYAEIARFLGLPAGDEAEAAAGLVEAIRTLARLIGQPTTLRETGLSAEEFEQKLPKLVDNAVNDSAMIIGTRFPEDEEVGRVYRCMYDGVCVDF